MPQIAFSVAVFIDGYQIASQRLRGTIPFIEAAQEALQLLGENVDGNEPAQIADDITERKYTVSVNDVLRLPTDQIRERLADLAIPSYQMYVRCM